MAADGKDEAAVEPEDLSDHPGRPREPDEIDPVLARLPRRGGQRSPILAGLVVFFCSYLTFQLWSDFSYSRAGDAVPMKLSDLSGATPNQFVEVAAVPDRANMVRVAVGKADEGRRLTPVLGTSGAVWIMQDKSPWRDPVSYGEMYRGRLYRLGDMPFYSNLVAHFRTATPVAQVLTTESARAALETGATELTTSGGDQITVTGDSKVRISQRVAGRAQITAAVTDDYPDEATWMAALGRAGLMAPGTKPVSSTGEAWIFSVPAPDGVDAVSSVLDGAQLYGARAQAVLIERSASWSQLSSATDELDVAGLPMPWSEIESFAVAAAPIVRTDARLIVTNEQPERYWYVLPLIILLSAISLFFLWGVFRSIRAAKAANQPAG